jgi:hypothetical protein
MPTELVWFGGVLVAIAGLVVFAAIHRHTPARPPHFW